MSRYIRFRDFDWVLLLFVLIICMLGVSEIYSATLHTKFEGMHIKQVYWIVAGVCLMFLVSLINYQALLEMVPWLYGFSLVSLVAVLLFGKRYLGAKRWIDFQFFHFQPSEWVKLILILTMAKYFAEYRDNDLPFRELVKAGLVVLFPMLLVLKQPDLGTALTYIPIAVMALALGGMRLKHGIVLLLIAAVLMPAMWKWGLKPYQKERLSTFVVARSRFARLGLPGDPVAGGRRLGRRLGQGRGQGNPDPGTVPPRSAHRFHLCRLERGAWLCGRVGGNAAILRGVDAFDP